MQNVDQKDQKTEERLVVAGIGRPTFPERILDDFPDLTVTDYLRFRVTGQLPEEIEAGLKKGAEKFIAAGLKAARMPKPEVVLPEDFITPETTEDVSRGLDLLRTEAERLLKSEEVSLHEANRFVAHMRLTTKAAYSMNFYPDSYRTFQSVAEKAESLLEENSGSTEARVVCCAITLAANGVRHRFFYMEPKRVSQVFLQELACGRTDTLRTALTVPELTEATFFSINYIVEKELNPEILETIFQEVLPGLRAIGEDTREKHLISDYRLGEYGKMLKSLVSKISEFNGSLPEKSLQEEASFLTEIAAEFLKNGNFLCHSHAVGILEGLREIYVAKGIKPENLDELVGLVDMIIEKKVEDFPACYPNVAKIKKLVADIMEATEGQSVYNSLFEKTYLEKIQKFLKDLPDPVSSLFRRLQAKNR